MNKFLIIIALLMVSQMQAMPGKKSFSPKKSEKTFSGLVDVDGRRRSTPADSFAPSFKPSSKPGGKPCDRRVPGVA